MSSIFFRAAGLTMAVSAVIWSVSTHAMKWKNITNAEILAASDLVVEGKIERVASAPDVTARGMSDGSRDPAKGHMPDAVAVADVKVTRTLKGQADSAAVTVVYWNGFGDRDQSHFSKFETPRRLKPGQWLILALRMKEPAAFDGFSAPPEAKQAKWMFAFDPIYDAQIQTPAFAAGARAAERRLREKTK